MIRITDPDHCQRAIDHAAGLGPASLRTLVQRLFRDAGASDVLIEISPDTSYGCRYNFGFTRFVPNGAEWEATRTGGIILNEHTKEWGIHT
jgi:hypothetical protein